MSSGSAVEQPSPTESSLAESHPAEQARSDRALQRYRRRLRPWRITYAAVILALIVAAGVVVKLAYVHGELSHTTLVTATAAAPQVPLREPSADLTRAWSSSDHTAIGSPVVAGTVVTYSTHTVAGRDAVTGAVRWSYTRTDRTTCTAAQLDNVTIAVFRLHGDCTELTGLDSSTGRRLWTRTLFENSNLVTGTPAFTVGNDTFVVTTPQVSYALSPDGTADTGNGGLDRWVFAQTGCTINSVAFGSAGALISQTCTDPQCANRTLCGKGPQLLLRDPFQGVSDTDNDKNPDQIKWNLIGNSMLPVSAGAVISAAAPGSTSLTTFSTAGKKIATLPLTSPMPTRSARVTPPSAAAADAQLVRIGTTTYAVAPSGTSYLWHADTAALPVLTPTGSGSPPPLSSARIDVPLGAGASGGGGIAELSPVTGQPTRRFAVPAPAAGSTGSRVYPLGTGFLVAGPRTVVYR